MNLKFHWRLVHGHEPTNPTRAAQTGQTLTGKPELTRQVEFCRQAEQAGIRGLLTDVGATKPDPILLALALGLATEKIEFIVAYRSGFIPPTTFVQQLNTLSNLIDGRFSLNIVAGDSPREQAFYGDFLSHDARYDRTEEFLAVCHAFWDQDGDDGVDFDGKHYRIRGGRLNTRFSSPRGRSPEIFVAGGSDSAQRVAIGQGSCWMRLADTPEKVKASCEAVLQAGKEVGLRLSIIARPTRDEAILAANELVRGLDPSSRNVEKEKAFVLESDSVSNRKVYELANDEWISPTLWTGAVRTHGAPSLAIVGSPEDVAATILEYKDAGVSQFIFSGWPQLESMRYFGEAVLPLIRAQERKAVARV